MEPGITVTSWLDETRIRQVDARITGWMARHGVLCSRLSLGIVFLWFGGLKLFPGLSPAEALVGNTVSALSGGLIAPRLSVPALGMWEVLIGAGLLSGRWLRATLVLLFAQMIGTVSPAFLFPGDVFVRFPYALTFEGQYIAKNVVLVSAAIVIGATVRGGSLNAEPCRSSAPTVGKRVDLDSWWNTVQAIPSGSRSGRA